MARTARRPSPIRWALLMAGVAVPVWLAVEAADLGQLLSQTSAKAACQCRYIDGGDDAFCVADDIVDFVPMTHAFDAADSQVTASLWGIGRATGRYVPETGCVVE